MLHFWEIKSTFFPLTWQVSCINCLKTSNIRPWMERRVVWVTTYLDICLRARRGPREKVRVEEPELSVRGCCFLVDDISKKDECTWLLMTSPQCRTTLHTSHYKHSNVMAHPSTQPPCTRATTNTATWWPIPVHSPSATHKFIWNECWVMKLIQLKGSFIGRYFALVAVTMTVATTSYL